VSGHAIASAHISQLQLPCSRRSLQSGGDSSSHSARLPPVTSTGGFPAPHGLLHCASPPKHHLGSRIVLQRNRTSGFVLPTWEGVV